jgi:hypothetical protein
LQSKSRTKIRSKVRTRKHLDRQIARQDLSDDLDMVVHLRARLLTDPSATRSPPGGIEDATPGRDGTYVGEAQNHRPVGLDRDLGAADLGDLADDADNAVLEVLEVLGCDARGYAGHFCDLILETLVLELIVEMELAVV